MRTAYTDPKTGRVYWNDNPEDVKALQELDPLGRRATAQASIESESPTTKESSMISEVTKDDTFFIHCLYDYVLGRKPDEEGLRFWESYTPRSNLVAAFVVEAKKELAART